MHCTQGRVGGLLVRPPPHHDNGGRDLEPHFVAADSLHNLVASKTDSLAKRDGLQWCGDPMPKVQGPKKAMMGCQ